MRWTMSTLKLKDPIRQCIDRIGGVEVVALLLRATPLEVGHWAGTGRVPPEQDAEIRRTDSTLSRGGAARKATSPSGKAKAEREAKRRAEEEEKQRVYWDSQGVDIINGGLVARDGRRL